MNLPESRKFQKLLIGERFLSLHLSYIGEQVFERVVTQSILYTLRGSLYVMHSYCEIIHHEAYKLLLARKERPRAT